MITAQQELQHIFESMPESDRELWVAALHATLAYAGMRDAGQNVHDTRCERKEANDALEAIRKRYVY